MPVDPSIPMSVRGVQIDSPITSMARIGELQAQQQAGQMRAQQMEMQRRQMAAQEAQAATQAEVSQAWPGLMSVDRQEFLSKLSPEGQLLAQQTLMEFDKYSTEQDKLRSAAELAQVKRRAGLARAVKQAGNDPSIAAVAFSLEAERDPEVAQLWDQIGQDPSKLPQIVDYFIAQDPDFKPPEGFTLNPGDVRFDASGQQIATVPKPAPEPTPYTLTPGSKRFDAQGNLIAEVPASPREPAAEPLVPIIGSDGQPVLVPRSQAIGKRPASNREQGRPVTAGDAGMFAELDTALDDLATLRNTLTETKDATGTSAAVGAAMPAWATDLFGWGTDAKKRQGVIDRVKQVIGKALEGGVLRKEDEIKYAKILPTIQDTAAVAESKLAGLEKAIALKKQRELDARDDAGYDVLQFRKRQQSTGGDGWTDLGNGIRIREKRP